MKTRRNTSTSIAYALLLFAVYFWTARAGLALNAVSGFATLVWLPSGISVAMLYLFGLPLAPAVFCAAFLVNFLNGAPLPIALGIGAGNMAEALLGASLLQRVKVSSGFEQVRDVLLLSFLVTPFSAAFSATIGVSSLLLGHLVIPRAYGATWLVWWTGDALSILIMTPLLLTWRRTYSPRLSPKRLGEAIALVACCMVAGILIFFGLLAHEGSQITYIVFPPLAWAALRFGTRGAVLVSSGLSVLLILASIASFSLHHLSENLLYLQGFLSTMIVSSLILASMTSHDHPAYEQTLSLFDTSPDALLMVNGAGMIVQLNDHVENMFGYKRTELLAKSLNILLPERFRSAHSIHLMHYFVTPEARPMGKTLDLYGRHKDGHEIHVDISLRPLVITGSLYAIAAIRAVPRQ